MLRLPLPALCVLCGCLAACLPAVAAAPTTYYIDCRSGNDASDGRSAGTAWKTLARANAVALAAGDSVLLKRGGVCEGAFTPVGSGTPDAPITLDEYGAGTAPVIDGGNAPAAVALYNQQGWHIENIETTGGTRYGIHIGGSGRALRHFRLTNVSVHDVNGALTSKDSGLIVISPGGAPTTFSDILIDGATAWNTTQWAGIEITGADYVASLDAPHGVGVTIRNSIVHDVYGDGIVLFLVQNGLIETSAAWRTGQQPKETIGTPCAIWTWMCNECVSQFNEAWLSNSPGVDGSAFDIDWGTRNNVVQNNYGHDNKGYCASVFGAEGLTSLNATIQFNVCANNARDAALATRQGDLFLSTWDNGAIDGVSVHDNVFYWNPAVDAPLVNNSASFTEQRGQTFTHNVIVSQTPSLVLSNASLALDYNRYGMLTAAAPQFTYAGAGPMGFAAYQSQSGQDLHSTDATATQQAATPPSSPFDAALLGDATGSPALVALLDASPASHSQLVVLRSLSAQYAGDGLLVRVAGLPDPGWRLDGVTLSSTTPGSVTERRSARPTTFLVDATGRAIQRWDGYTPAQSVGPAVQRLLGLWRFGDPLTPATGAPTGRVVCPHGGCAKMRVAPAQ
jgi:hypothetical protein